ncbi:Hypothetical protein FKW44_000292 [Caligus rogercresseyi]|uniref:Uncharacterized protein n=1 Tax=Caligus rogercresseyi TaxID=217165 RepID=A0A7T8QUS3_CALRO|nr:Hypothetical protein FKW44_000292 [Caligus rogercresseyi]
MCPALLGQGRHMQFADFRVCRRFQSSSCPSPDDKRRACKFELNWPRHVAAYL